jgi:hypothetical protein
VKLTSTLCACTNRYKITADVRRTLHQNLAARVLSLDSPGTWADKELLPIVEQTRLDHTDLADAGTDLGATQTGAMMATIHQRQKNTRQWSMNQIKVTTVDGQSISETDFRTMYSKHTPAVYIATAIFCYCSSDMRLPKFNHTRT